MKTFGLAAVKFIKHTYYGMGHINGKSEPGAG